MGASDCLKRFGTCDLSQGIVTDDSAGTVTFHLRAPDADFLRKLALPFAVAVPASIGKQEIGNTPVPATGPYVLATFSPREVRLARNPRFHEWSHLAKPDGYPNEIVWTTGLSVDEQLNRIVSGKADAMVGSPSDRPDAARIAQLRAQYPAQVHPWVSGTLLFQMNTSVPPFNDVNVRRAVNLAIDRAKLVDLAGGPLLAEVTCQVILPNTQGYRPYCPYTANPNPGGAWTGPNGVKARQLVAASGKAGAPVRIATFGQFTASAEYLKSVLVDLGFKATVLSADDVQFEDLYDPVNGRNTQALVIAWFPDFPAASSTVVPMFGCTSDLNFGRFCDRAIAAQTNRALDLQQSDAAAAGVAWAKVDQMLVDAAPVAALDNEREIDFVSARVGNYQSHPQWKILFDQLWVH